jgi:hypothetical protein
MTVRCSRLATAALVILAGLSGAAVAAAQTTRAEAIDAEREQRAAAAEPQRRPLVERVLFRIEDDLLIERFLNAPRGIFLRLGGIGEGSGFGAGPAFRYNTSWIDVKTSFAASVKKYTIAEATVRFPGTIGHDVYIRASGPFVELHARHRDAPQEDFFGLGPGSAEADRSDYALRDTFGSITGGLARRNLKTGVMAGYLATDVGPGSDPSMPSSTVVFRPSEVPGLAGEPRFIVAGPFVLWQTRDRSINVLDGGEYRASWMRYRDQTDWNYSFDRWDVDLRQYFTFVKQTRTIALRAWAAAANSPDGHQPPFYMQPWLGGGYTLRGYRTFRFRDRSALLLQAEYRWRVNEFVQGAFFYDTGAVAAALDQLGRLERNWGFGLRAGSRMGSAFRMDSAFC